MSAPGLLALLGAGGDLAARSLHPALAELEAAGRLPEGLVIVGVSRSQCSDDEYRDAVAGALDAHAGDPVTPAVRDRLLARLRHLSGDATDPVLLRRLPWPDDRPGVAYLALPPAVFPDVVDALADLDVNGEVRVAIEKPFGTDLASARDLNVRLARGFDEDHVFRVDHFLGHQSAKNLLAARFANRAFGALWCRDHVERVEIVWDETLGLEGRAGYYDRTGALRDMVQNHLLQLTALVAMDEPESLDVADLRERKVELLRAVRPPEDAEVASRTVRARYGAGTVDGRELPDYVDEEGVDAARDTETHVAVELLIDAPAWYDVPFVIRTGKAQSRDRRRVDLVLQPARGEVFVAAEAQRVRFGIDPDHLTIDLALSGPGPGLALEPACAEVDLVPAGQSAYARVLHSVLAGDRMLSVGPREAEEQWRIVGPILDAWRHGDPPLVEHPAGHDGPRLPVDQMRS